MFRRQLVDKLILYPEDQKVVNFRLKHSEAHALKMFHKALSIALLLFDSFCFVLELWFHDRA